MRIELRQASPEDLPQVYAITEAAMRAYVERSFGPWIEDFQRSVIGKSFDPATHRLIYVEGALAGVAAAVTCGNHIQLEKLYLLPLFQRHGIGANVLRELQQLATGRACRELCRSPFL
jgi:GNAT superfamily N-acetyltransferase